MAISEITIGKEENATTSTTYSLGPGCSSNTELKPVLDDGCKGWLTATGDIGKTGTLSLRTTQANPSNNTRSGYIIPSLDGNQCPDYKLKVIQEAGDTPEPGDCKCTSTGDFHFFFGGGECQCYWDTSAYPNVCNNKCSRATTGNTRQPGLTVSGSNEVYCTLEPKNPDYVVTFHNGENKIITAKTLAANTSYAIDFSGFNERGREEHTIVTMCNKTSTKIVDYLMYCPTNHVFLLNKTGKRCNIGCTVRLSNGETKEIGPVAITAYDPPDHDGEKDMAWVQKDTTTQEPVTGIEITGIVKVTCISVDGDIYTNYTNTDLPAIDVKITINR